MICSEDLIFGLLNLMQQHLCGRVRLAHKFCSCMLTSVSQACTVKQAMWNKQGPVCQTISLVSILHVAPTAAACCARQLVEQHTRYCMPRQPEGTKTVVWLQAT